MPSKNLHTGALVAALADEAGPTLVWVIDWEGKFQFLEGRIPFLPGLSPAELIRESIFTRFSGFPQLLADVRLALEGRMVSGMVSEETKNWAYKCYPAPGISIGGQGVIGILYDAAPVEELWHQQAVADTAAELRKAKTYETMPSVIIGRLNDLLHIDQAALIAGSPPEHPFELVYSWGDWTGVAASDQEITSILKDEAVIESLNGSGRIDQSLLPEGIDATNLNGVCLKAQDDLIGALWIGRESPLSRRESRLIDSIADMTANAFQRARQHQLTRRRMEHLTALHAIDKAISGSFNLNLTLHIILEQVIAQLNVDAADIFLYDSDVKILTYAEGQGFLRYQPEMGISQKRENLVWKVLQKRDLLTISNLNEEATDLVPDGMFELEGFQAYNGIPLIAKGEILGVLEVFHRQEPRIDHEWINLLRTIGTQAAIAMDNAALVENLRRINLKLDQAYHSTLEGWVRALDLRDKSTGGHTQRVVDLTVKLAQAVGISTSNLVHIRRGALLHDIGKLGIPDEILNKKGPLSDSEWDLMRQHPIFARDLLEPIDFLHPALPIPYSHHEKWDGSGYPLGISGSRIPLEARIFTVIDVWDALSSSRPYRPAWKADKIHQYILEQAGLHFDPEVVRIWEKVFRIKELEDH